MCACICVCMYMYIYVCICLVLQGHFVRFPKILVFGVNDLVVAMPGEMRTTQSINFST